MCNDHPRSKVDELVRALITAPMDKISWRETIYPNTYATDIGNYSITIVDRENDYFILVNDMCFQIDGNDEIYDDMKHLINHKIKQYFIQKNIEMDRVIETINNL